MQIDIVEDSRNLKSKIDSQLSQMLLVAETIGEFNKIQFNVCALDEIDLNLFRKNNVLYFIKIIDFGNNLNSLSFCEKIKEIKEIDTTLKLPKVNFENINADNSLLYVGKSTNNFAKRMKQHFGKSSKTTYSLHIEKWLQFPELCSMKFEIYYHSIDFVGLNIVDHEEQKQLLELLETALHYKYKPLLGRTGH